MTLQSLALAAFAAFSASLITSGTEAATRINSQNLSCNSVKSTIINNGSAIVRYASKRNPSLTLYDRYVASSYECARGEIAEWSSIPAKGGESCRLLVCNRYDPSNYEFGVPRRVLYLR